MRVDLALVWQSDIAQVRRLTVYLSVGGGKPCLLGCCRPGWADDAGREWIQVAGRQEQFERVKLTRYIRDVYPGLESVRGERSRRDRHLGWNRTVRATVGIIGWALGGRFVTPPHSLNISPAHMSPLSLSWFLRPGSPSSSCSRFLRRCSSSKTRPYDLPRPRSP